MGAVVKSEWLGMRISGEALKNLAAQSISDFVP